MDNYAPFIGVGMLVWGTTGYLAYHFLGLLTPYLDYNKAKEFEAFRQKCFLLGLIGLVLAVHHASNRN